MQSLGTGTAKVVLKDANGSPVTIRLTGAHATRRPRRNIISYSTLQQRRPGVGLQSTGNRLLVSIPTADTVLLIPFDATEGLFTSQAGSENAESRDLGYHEYTTKSW